MKSMKSWTVAEAAESVRWLTTVQVAQQPRIGRCRCAADVEPIMRRACCDPCREVFAVALLDAQHVIRAVHVVSVGSAAMSVVHPREVFGVAVRASAAAVIVAHNHPSGSCTPSAEDLAVTRRLRDAGDILGIPLLDHLVLGEGGEYCSMRSQTDAWQDGDA